LSYLGDFNSGRYVMKGLAAGCKLEGVYYLFIEKKYSHDIYILDILYNRRTMP